MGMTALRNSFCLGDVIRCLTWFKERYHANESLVTLNTPANVLHLGPIVCTQKSQFARDCAD